MDTFSYTGFIEDINDMGTMHVMSNSPQSSISSISLNIDRREISKYHVSDDVTVSINFAGDMPTDDSGYSVEGKIHNLSYGGGIVVYKSGVKLTSINVGASLVKKLTINQPIVVTITINQA